MWRYPFPLSPESGFIYLIVGRLCPRGGAPLQLLIINY
ncbi:hypothetical protein SPLC1_S171490 [Arthrospira platensis C1]|nr:hypothetical protein SPLC1_S171490 [Arthrospira platensis C1]